MILRRENHGSKDGLTAGAGLFSMRCHGLALWYLPLPVWHTGRPGRQAPHACPVPRSLPHGGHDFICIADGGQAMGDDNGGAAFD